MLAWRTSTLNTGFNSRLREEATGNLSIYLSIKLGFNSRLREEATQ